MSYTPNLTLPEFGASGVPSGLELTKGMRRLDAVVQLSVTAFLTAPPVFPVLGDRYIVASPATAEFATHELHVAFYTQDGWLFLVPRNGWLAVVGTALWVFDEATAAWVLFDIDFFSPMTTKGDLLAHSGSGVVRLGVGADGQMIYADSTQSTGLRWGAAPSGGGGGGGGNVGPDDHPGTPNNADDEFEFGSGLDTTGSRFGGATAWTWRNQGTSTFAVNKGHGVLTTQIGTGTSHRIVEQPTSGATFKYRAKLSGMLLGINNSSAMHVAVNSSGRSMLFGYYAASTGATNMGIYLQKVTNATTFSSNALATAAGSAAAVNRGAVHYGYFEIEYDGTNVWFRYSASGVDGTFVVAHSETAATFLLAAPDRVGLNSQSGNAADPGVMVCDWFRKVA